MVDTVTEPRAGEPRSIISDLGLVELQAAALFTHDLDRRIHYVNEPDGRQAPRFFFGRTGAGNVWRFRYDLPTSLVDALGKLAADEPIAATPSPYPACIDLLRAALTGHHPIAREHAGPAYRFPDGLSAVDGVVAIDAQNAHLLRPGFADLILEARQPCFAVVRDGVAVSVCFSSRRTPRAAEAGVDTLDGFRGRGYATLVTTAWARAVRERGLIPLYSTTWDNLASQGVARRLRLILYGVDLSIT